MLDSEPAVGGLGSPNRYLGIDTKVSTLPSALPRNALRPSAAQVAMTITGSTLNSYAKALQRKEISESRERVRLARRSKQPSLSGKEADRLRQHVTQMVTLAFARH